MIALLQRVSEARVVVAGERIANIQQGLLVLVGVEASDDQAEVRPMLERLINYRVFADQDGKMNLSLQDVAGGLLLVPQFTLAANTSKGRRPSFTGAAPPPQAQRLFETMVSAAREIHDPVGSGRFGAVMQVESTNDGPVSFILD